MLHPNLFFFGSFDQQNQRRIIIAKTFYPTGGFWEAIGYVQMAVKASELLMVLQFGSASWFTMLAKLFLVNSGNYIAFRLHFYILDSFLATARKSILDGAALRRFCASKQSIASTKPIRGIWQ